MAIHRLTWCFPVSPIYIIYHDHQALSFPFLISFYHSFLEDKGHSKKYKAQGTPRPHHWGRSTEPCSHITLRDSAILTVVEVPFQPRLRDPKVVFFFFQMERRATPFYHAPKDCHRVSQKKTPPTTFFLSRIVCLCFHFTSLSLSLCVRYVFVGGPCLIRGVKQVQTWIYRKEGTELDRQDACSHVRENSIIFATNYYGTVPYNTCYDQEWY